MIKVMKYVKKLIFLLLINITIFLTHLPAYSQKTNRPKIGLVLSGGGARGAAHIGVIRALEEMNIPIDYISGTSIGALVGGMYASGIKIDEIESLIHSIDWTNVLDDSPSFKNLQIRKKEELKKRIHPLDLGIKKFKITMPKGIVSGQKISFLIQSIMLKGKLTNNFDELPIPFRVVATDISTGKMVVISEGNLGKALQGSMSVPGAFAPVKYGEHLLVDGGLTNNIPISVAKGMGADIIIAVDIASGLIQPEKLDNVLNVTRQMIKIMMKKSTDEQIILMGKQDILIVPNMENVDSSQFDKMSDAVLAGYDSTIMKKQELSHLALTNQEYEKYSKRKQIIKEEDVIVKNIIVSDNSTLNPEIFLKRIKARAGDKLDLTQLNKDFESIYETGYFQSVEFEFDKNKNLQINVKNKPWGPNFINLGVNYTDNFKGDNSLNFLINLTKVQINSIGGELQFEIVTGSRQSFLVQYYQPIDFKNTYFIESSALYKKENTDIIPRVNNIIGEMEYQNFVGNFLIGLNFKNSGELKGGLQFQKGTSNVFFSQSNDFIVPEFDYPLDNFNNTGVTLNFTLNTMEKPYFPTYGTQLKIGYFKTISLFNKNDYSYDKFYFNYSKAYSVGLNSILLKGYYGSSFKNNAPIYDGFRVIGLLGVSGSDKGLLTGSHIFQTGIYYYNEVSKIKSMYRVFAGCSFETGNIWLDKKDIDFGNLFYTGTVYTALETPVGPVYCGLSYTKDLGGSLFLSIGSIF